MFSTIKLRPKRTEAGKADARCEAKKGEIRKKPKRCLSGCQQDQGDGERQQEKRHDPPCGEAIDQGAGGERGQDGAKREDPVLPGHPCRRPAFSLSERKMVEEQRGHDERWRDERRNNHVKARLGQHLPAGMMAL